MLAIILADEPVLTSTDTTEVEQIQRELQRRAQKELEFLNI
jgi:ABC-type phosphate/phosphonate transport system ATPase subunit